MINFTRPDEAGQLRKKLTRRVKGWVEEALPDQYADWLIMVNEMQCFEPGCAPLETVISLLGQEKESRIFKLFKPLKELEPMEVQTALAETLAGNVRAQHLQGQPQQATTTSGAHDSASR